jgi:hypothetical protein
MPDPISQEFLREEYFHLQKTVEDFDQRTLLIKGWSVTASLGAIGLAFSENVPELLPVAAASALLFWVIEALWKSFQQAYYPRIKAIENHLRGTDHSPFSSPEIMRSWCSAWRWHSFIPLMAWAHVALPHAVICLAGLLLWQLNPRHSLVPS